MTLRRSLSVIPVLAVLLALAPLRLEAQRQVFNGKIAFESNRDGNNEIYTMSPNGTGQTRLTNQPASDANADWSFDGSKIAFASTRVSGFFHLFVMNADGSEQTLIPGPGADAAPAWSPDGQRIAFHSGDAGNFDIWLMSADGSNQVQLTTDPAKDLQPRWSPDGKKIIFRSLRDAGVDHLFIMNADGTAQTRLTNTAFPDQDPSFSPDGTFIVFTRLTPTQQIFRMNADGTGLVQLTDTGKNTSPAISPDGSLIAFISERDGNPEIYTMNVDGSSQVRRTNNPAAERQPRWQPLLPRTTVGVYRPTTGQWLLRNSNSAGGPDVSLTFGGQEGDLPVTGDWDGDGRTDIGIFRNGTFLLATLTTTRLCLPCPTITLPEPLPQFIFGQAGDRPIAGDWDGDGKTDVGVYRDGGTDGSSTFLLRTVHQATVHACPICPALVITAPVTETHAFGTGGDLPVVGDWDADGKVTIGIFRPSFDGGLFLLTNDFFKLNISFLFGTPDDVPIAGDWTGSGHDLVGTFRPTTPMMSLGSQLFAGPDIVFQFGAFGDLPVAGHWKVNAP